MNWDNVEMIRNAQSSAQKRFDAEHIATQETIEKAMQSEAFKELSIPRMTELESMIFKMRSELIDYIVAHGLVDGLIFNGVLRPVENGKIIITGDMISEITEVLGYYKKDDVERLLGEYLPAHDYVSDAAYTHTDNNYTDADAEKLGSVETGSEVNKIIDLIFNGVSVLDDGTRVATITITPEDIKRWYESNANTNAYTDAEKTKLAGISDGAEVNRVDDVLVAGRSVMDGNKKANITAEVVKAAYESNADTNAYTDAEKENLAQLVSWKPSAETDIKANAAAIDTVSGSVSELGDEVNSVAGRVSTLENQKLTVFTVKDSALKDLRSADEDLNGRQPGELTFTALFKDAAGHQRTVKEILITGLVGVSDGYLGIGDMFSVYKNAGTSGLYAAAYHMDDELDPSLQFYWDASKDPGFIPTSVTCSDYAFNTGLLITGAVIDGDELPQVGGKVNLTDITKWIPYEGAGGAPDLNGNQIKNIGTPTADTDAATKKYVDDAATTLQTNIDDGIVEAAQYTDSKTDNRVPYTGATQSVDMGEHDITNVTALSALNVGVKNELEITKVDTGGDVRLVAGEGAELRVEEPNSTTLARVQVGTPVKDVDAATKAYVDAQSGGGGSGLIVEGTATDHDFSVVAVTAATTVMTTLRDTDLTYDTSTAVFSIAEKSASKTATIRENTRIIFVPVSATSAGVVTYRSLMPVFGGYGYLQYLSNAPTTLKVWFHGIVYTSEIEIEAVSSASATTSSTLLTTNTVRYYKFA